MKRFFTIKKIKKVLKKLAISAFLMFWAAGMLTGGLYGMAAVACGIPFVVGISVFE